MNNKLFIKSTSCSLGNIQKPNSYFEEYLDTNDEWISSRTGIKSRFHVDNQQDSLTLALDSVKTMFENDNIDKNNISAVIVASATSAKHSTAVPSIASHVVDYLNINALAFDINAACSGFSYALIVANSLMNTTQNNISGDILVIGVDTMSTVVDHNDRNTIILFGDASGAVLLSKDDNKTFGIELLSTDMQSIPNTVDILEIPKDEHNLYMAGKEVFKHAVKSVQHSIENVLSNASIKGEDITCFIPHQANIRIIDYINLKTGIKSENTIVNIDKYGNTSAASIPLALHEAMTDNKISEGYLLISGFGAGMTLATSLWRVTK